MRFREVILTMTCALFFGSTESIGQGIAVNRIDGALELGAEASLQDLSLIHI